MSDTNSPGKTFEIILREHTRLLELLDRIRQILFERTADYGEAQRLLVQLQRQVDAHFHTEESSGCFGDVVNHAPRVSGKVGSLIAEHAELSEDLGQLVARASEASGSAEDWEETSARFADFNARLMQHETVENDLLQEVFTEDIGSKD